jgi:hypothetical protein
VLLSTAKFVAGTFVSQILSRFFRPNHLNKLTSEFTDAVMRLELIDPEPPSDSDPGNQLGFEIWKLNIKEHQMRMQEYSIFRSRSL